MPTDPTRGYIIGIRQTGGSSGQSTISVTNARTSETFHVLTTSNEIKVDLNNTKIFPSGYNDGDVIDITGTGLKTGNGTITVNRARGGSRITLAMVDASTTNAPAVTI